MKKQGPPPCGMKNVGTRVEPVIVQIRRVKLIRIVRLLRRACRQTPFPFQADGDCTMQFKLIVFE
jgi:hypothetical protein